MSYCRAERSSCEFPFVVLQNISNRLISSCVVIFVFRFFLDFFWFFLQFFYFVFICNFFTFCFFAIFFLFLLSRSFIWRLFWWVYRFGHYWFHVSLNTVCVIFRIHFFYLYISPSTQLYQFKRQGSPNCRGLCDVFNNIRNDE